LSLIEIKFHLGIGLEPNLSDIQIKKRFLAPIDPASPFARSAMMRKIARIAYQAIFVGGIGRVPNRFPHDCRKKSSMGVVSHVKIAYPMIILAL